MKTKKLAIGALLLVMLSFLPTKSVSSAESSGSVVLSKENTITLTGEVNGQSVAKVISKAKELDNAMSGVVGSRLGMKSKKPLYLFLYTPGGEIQTGLEMIEALKGLGRPVHTITLFAASMGFQVAQALDDRLILKSGALMSHHAAGQFSGQFGGAPTQLDSRYGFWLERIKELDMQTVARTKGKQTYESYIKAYDKEVWLTGTQSVTQGYADRVVTVKCDSTLSGVTTNSINFFGLLIQYDLDDCPLNTSPMNIRVTAPGGQTILTTNQVEEARSRFLKEYEEKARQVIPMRW